MGGVGIVSITSGLNGRLEDYGGRRVQGYSDHGYLSEAYAIGSYEFMRVLEGVRGGAQRERSNMQGACPAIGSSGCPADRYYILVRPLGFGVAIYGI